LIRRLFISLFLVIIAFSCVSCKTAGTDPSPTVDPTIAAAITPGDNIGSDGVENVIEIAYKDIKYGDSMVQYIVLDGMTDAAMQDNLNQTILDFYSWTAGAAEGTDYHYITIAAGFNLADKYLSCYAGDLQFSSDGTDLENVFRTMLYDLGTGKYVDPYTLLVFDKLVEAVSGGEFFVQVGDAPSSDIFAAFTDALNENNGNLAILFRDYDLYLILNDVTDSTDGYYIIGITYENGAAVFAQSLLDCLR